MLFHTGVRSHVLQFVNSYAHKFAHNVELTSPQVRRYAARKRKKRAPYVPANALPFVGAVSVVKAMEVGWPNHTFELHIKLRSEKGAQTIRGSVNLPKSMSKTARFLVFARGPKVEEALAAGAHVVGGEEVVTDILEGTFKFGEIDRCISTIDMLPSVLKIAKILGPRQLMPTVKKGTVTDDIAGTIKEMAGKFEFRNDKSGIIHAGIGKLSWTVNELKENIRVLLNEINDIGKAHASKSSTKSIIEEVCLNATRSPGIYILDYKDLINKDKSSLKA